MNPRPIALLALLVASPAGAVPALELVGGVEPDRPLAGAAGVVGADAAYTNPARLDFATPTFSLGVFAIGRALDLDLDARPAGYDVPATVRDARAIDPDGGTRRLDRRPLPTAELAPRGDVDPSGVDTLARIGASVPLITDHLAVGLTIVLPLAGLQSQAPHYADERQQAFDNSLHYELLGDRLALTTFTLAVGGRLFDRVAIGVGATLLQRAETRAALYVPDAGDVSIADDQTDVEVGSAIAPHIGLDVQLYETLHLAATVHLPSETRIEGGSEIRFFDYDYPDGQDALYQRFEYAFAHEPLRVGAGLTGAVDLGEWRLDAWLDGRYTRYSAYRDRYTATPADWSDTLDGRLGLRAAHGDTALALGLGWHPSPVPEQTGRTNYVDCARATAQLGARQRFAIDAGALTVGLGVQLQRWLERSHQKQPDAADPVVDELPDAIDTRTGAPLEGSAGLQTNNPGFPGYTTGGWLWVVIASVGVEL